jgi:phosphoribosylamine--glycine ligase
MVSGGYPGNYKKGFPVSGLDSTKECVVFHSGTSVDVETAGIKTSGGRVFALTALDFSIESTRKAVYKNVKKVEFTAVAFRKDIGEDLMAYKK